MTSAVCAATTIVTPVALKPGTSTLYYGNVSLLGHCDAQRQMVNWVYPARGNTFSAGAGGAIVATTRKFGPTTIELDGQNELIQSASHADYNFGTGDFTVAVWVNPNSLTREYNTSKLYIDMRNTSLTAAWVPTIGADNDTGGVRYSANGSVRITSANAVMTAGAWNHVMACRVSSVTYLFINGNLEGQFNDSNTYVQNPVTIGAASNSGGTCRGYFDEILIIKGVGLYSASFTVPPIAYANQ